ncbi:molybdate ABC transporter substrate-binding protein [Ovoidimarina sediminis]|uniref:molybdate ABC transporter substrate-binding protein n=1 Tax=Ovoidimarina sediminis TaxID=3079856 RepID=UPI0029111728|nr:molybdate ABC transporter substrate-binding protein [Rhodophyticola sp. MJ-SS7]MDU8941992.1 molybdate ABC transporter substrate-binding protein [Rhodophyticola sp. MJ-SS7]
MCLGLLAIALPARAEEATIAVAANFLTTARTLAEAYEAESGHDLILAHGSTGRLYAQILAGAPFDLFLAADQARPADLETRGVAVARMTYAVGEVVLVSRTPIADPLAELDSTRVALANPEIAPYGATACAALAAIGGDCAGLEARMGDSVGQAASLFVTGNADLALLARSQLPSLDGTIHVHRFDVPEGRLAQDAVLLARGADNPAARGFYDFLATEAARATMDAAGYERAE